MSEAIEELTEPARAVFDLAREAEVAEGVRRSAWRNDGCESTSATDSRTSTCRRSALPGAASGSAIGRSVPLKAARWPVPPEAGRRAASSRRGDLGPMGCRCPRDEGRPGWLIAVPERARDAAKGASIRLLAAPAARSPRTELLATAI